MPWELAIQKIEMSYEHFSKTAYQWHDIARIIAGTEAEYQSEAPHTLPLRASYRVSFVNILKTVDRVITVPHCIIPFYNAYVLSSCNIGHLT